MISIIVPVLRPGNSHSNKWYVSILERGLIKIREAYPTMKIRRNRQNSCF